MCGKGGKDVKNAVIEMGKGAEGNENIFELEGGVRFLIWTHKVSGILNGMF